MKKILPILIIFFFIVFINFSFANKVSIIYTIDNNPITNVEITNEINYLKLISEDIKNLDDEALVIYASKSVIREKIKEIEVLKYFKFGLNNELVEENVSKIASSLQVLDQNEFDKILLNLDLDKNFLRRKIEIELLWNRLIYKKYINKLIVNEDKIKEDLRSKIDNNTQEIEEYRLYEILFSPKSSSSVNEDIQKIKNSIKEIGFEGTARIFSLSSTSTNGGEVGWVKVSQLSNEILKKISDLQNEEVSEIINVASGKIFLMIKERRKNKKEISFNDELKKMIIFTKNKQLSQYSAIYFKKVELNSTINEN